MDDEFYALQGKQRWNTVLLPKIYTNASGEYFCKKNQNPKYTSHVPIMILRRGQRCWDWTIGLVSDRPPHVFLLRFSYVFNNTFDDDFMTLLLLCSSP